MEVGYEEKFDQLAIILQDDYDYDRSIEVEPGFIIDLDKKNHIVAIEIIDCSMQINKDSQYIKDAKINAFIEVYEYSYKIIVDFNDGDCTIEKRLLKDLNN